MGVILEAAGALCCMHHCWLHFLPLHTLYCGKTDQVAVQGPTSQQASLNFYITVTLSPLVVDDIAYVAPEVASGESGKEFQSEDFKMKMQEVKASVSKGLDTFVLTARYVSQGLMLTYIGALLHLL